MWKLGYLRERKKKHADWLRNRNANKRPRGGRRMLWQELKCSNRLVSVYFSSCLVTWCYKVYCSEFTGFQTCVGSFRNSCLPQEPTQPTARWCHQRCSSLILDRLHGCWWADPLIEPRANQLSGPTRAKTTGRKEGRKERKFVSSTLISIETSFTRFNSRRQPSSQRRRVWAATGEHVGALPNNKLQQH